MDWRFSLGVFAVLAIALSLRIYHLGHESFWCDEFLTAEMTVGRGFAHEAIPTNRIVEHPPLVTDLSDRAPWWRVWPNQVAEGYPPLYVLIARFWRLVFGQGDVALRWLSLVCSIGAIVLLMDAVRIIHGRAPALWAGAIAALATPQIIFAQEARGYAMLLLFGAAAFCSLARIETLGANWRRASAFGISLAALLLIHYYAWGFALLLGTYALVQLHGPPRRAAVTAAIAAAIIAAALWGPWAIQQVNISHVTGTKLYFGDAQPGQFLRWTDRVLLLPVRYFYEPMRGSRSIAVIGGIAYLFLAWLFLRRRELRLWIVGTIGVIGLVALVDLVASTRQLDLIRYTLLGSLGIYAIVAAAPGRLPRPWNWLIPLIVVLACALSINTAYEPTKPNWRAVAADWSQTVQPGEITIFSGSSFAGPYSPSMTYVSTSFYRRSTGPIVVLEKAADQHLLGQLGKSPSFLLIASVLSPDPAKLLPNCSFERVGFEPFVARIYRVRFNG